MNHKNLFVFLVELKDLGLRVFITSFLNQLQKTCNAKSRILIKLFRVTIYACCQFFCATLSQDRIRCPRCAKSRPLVTYIKNRSTLSCAEKQRCRESSRVASLLARHC